MTHTSKFTNNAIFTRNLVFRLCCTSLFSVLLASGASADIYWPTGLNLGDQYRIAFVTSVHHDAQSTNINDYNTFVDAAANAPGTLTEGLNATWTAIGSTTTVDARDNTGTNPSSGAGVPIYLVNGSTQIATNNADLWDGNIANPLNLDEFGNTIAGAFVWTGTQSNGTASFAPLGGLGAHLGSSSATNSDWIMFASTGTQAVSNFYAISEVLEARAVPEPAAFVLFGSAILGLLRLRPARNAR